MTLDDLSLKQLQRLYRIAYARMSAGDGYQPFGYDWRTLWMTKPGWAKILQDIEMTVNSKLQSKKS